MRERDAESIRIAVLYEHPEWFKPIFEELDRREVPYDLWHAHRHMHDPRARSIPYSLVINRMSPSAYLRGHGSGIYYTAQLLAYLKDIQVAVINPYEAFMVETSKALQIEILEALALRYPRTRLISDPSLAPKAADGLEFPVMVKPNVGGSGAKIRKFGTEGELRRAAESGSIDLGFDSTGLVQEFLPARDNAIVRVEVLNGRFLYAIKIFTPLDGDYNLCPADICQEDRPGAKAGPEDEFSRCAVSPTSEKRRLHIESFQPPAEIIRSALAIAREAHLDVGGIEYLVNDRDGEIYFYDINALSNFVTDARRIVGFDPYRVFVDYVQQRALQEVPTALRRVKTERVTKYE